jgi:hypothetical protein
MFPLEEQHVDLPPPVGSSLDGSLNAANGTKRLGLFSYFKERTAGTHENNNRQKTDTGQSADDGAQMVLVLQFRPPIFTLSMPPAA